MRSSRMANIKYFINVFIYRSPKFLINIDNTFSALKFFAASDRYTYFAKVLFNHIGFIPFECCP